MWSVYKDQFDSTKYNYSIGFDSYWATQKISELTNCLKLSCVRSVFDVDRNYIGNDYQYYNLWQTSQLFASKTKPLTILSGNIPFTNHIPISEYYWDISYSDYITGRQWGFDRSNLDQSQGNILIISKKNVYRNSMKYVEVTGYINCKLVELNNPSNTKILQGKFNQLVSGYYDMPNP